MGTSFFNGTHRPILGTEFTYAQSLAAFATTQIIAAMFLHQLTPMTKPGLSRMLPAATVVSLNLLAPLWFDPHDSVTTVVLTAFNTAWLSSFKAILWAAGRSSLASHEQNAVQFATLLLTPLTPVADAPAKLRHTMHGPTPPRILLKKALAKAAMLAALLWLLQDPFIYVSPLRSFLYGLGLYGLLSAIMDGPGAAISQFLGIHVSPHFNSPWLASSVGSFWNARWDLAAGNALRALIFEPIQEGHLVSHALEEEKRQRHTRGKKSRRTSESTRGRGSPGRYWDRHRGDASAAEEKNRPPTRYSKRRDASPGQTTTHSSKSPVAASSSRPPPTAPKETVRRILRPLIGSTASFLTSGLVHEGIHWYLTGATSGRHLPWLCFFLVQVPVIAVEKAALGALRKAGIELPRPLLTVYTVLFESWAAAVFFWRPVEAQGVLQLVIDNVRRTCEDAYRNFMTDVSFVGNFSRGGDKLRDLGVVAMKMPLLVRGWLEWLKHGIGK